MPELQQILYCSLLAPHQPPHIVGQIATRARARNAAAGITGLLVFDGMRFCQHFEGPPEPVRSLVARLAADPRHTAMTLLFDGGLAQRRYARFEIGLAEVEDRDDLADIQALQGAAALELFLALRPRFDVAG